METQHLLVAVTSMTQKLMENGGIFIRNTCNTIHVARLTAEKDPEQITSNGEDEFWVKHFNGSFSLGILLVC